MIIFLYGQDSYRRLKKQQEVVGVFRERHSNLQEEHFDLQEEEDFGKLIDFITNRSMFGETKLGVVYNPFKSSKEKLFIDILKKEADNKDLIFLILASDSPKSKFKFLLEKPVQIQYFPELDNAKITFFINKEAEARGLKLPEDIAESIKEVFSSDTWGIVTELDKMALTSSRVVSKKTKSDYYPLVNLLKGGKSVKQRMVALELILSDRRDDPAKVFNSLSYRMDNQKSAKLFADYDIAVKSGKLDYEEVLVDLALR